MAKEHSLDELAKGFGDAVTDIHQKVVEEPMWGRAVTEQSTETQAPQWPQPERQQPCLPSPLT